MRLKFLASALPVLLASFVAGGNVIPGASPCISTGGVTLQMASSDWQNPLHVSFTSDPKAATVRVQIVDQPELADFVVIDDIATADTESCSLNNEMKFVSVTSSHAAGDPVIYLSPNGGADYRIFVQSRSFSVRDAAALIVGAGNATVHQRTAAL